MAGNACVRQMTGDVEVALCVGGLSVMGFEFLILSSVVPDEIVRDSDYGTEALCVNTDNRTELYSGKLWSTRA